VGLARKSARWPLMPDIMFVPCRAAVRSPQAQKAGSRLRGDALSAKDVAQALHNTDVVVQCLGVPASLDMVTRPTTLFSEATSVLVNEMEKASVKRLIAVTGFGAGDSKPRINPLQRLPFKLLLGRVYDNKSVQEQIIEQSDLDWLIVRPGVLTNGRATGRYRVLRTFHEWRNGIISRADVATFITAQMGEDALSREKPVLIHLPL